MRVKTYFCISVFFLDEKKCTSSGISIGIVTAIAAPASIKVDFEGSGGHAGAVLMPLRYKCIVCRIWIDRITRDSECF